MSVTQRIRTSAGSYREVRTPAVMFWAGDGHDHWHVRDVEPYRLIHLDKGRRLGPAPSMGSAISTTPPTGSGWRVRPAPRSIGAAAGQGTCGSKPGSRSAGVTPTRRGLPSSESTSPGSRQAATGCAPPPIRPTGCRDEQRQQQHLGRPQADRRRRSGGGLRAGRLTAGPGPTRTRQGTRADPREGRSLDPRLGPARPGAPTQCGTEGERLAGNP
jgi:hypothetical protein